MLTNLKRQEEVACLGWSNTVLFCILYGSVLCTENHCVQYHIVLQCAVLGTALHCFVMCPAGEGESVCPEICNGPNKALQRRAVHCLKYSNAVHCFILLCSAVHQFSSLLYIALQCSASVLCSVLLSTAQFIIGLNLF